MKNLFNLLLSDFFSIPSIDNMLDENNVTKESQTFHKGEFKTTITSYFSKDGRLVGTKSETKSIISPTKEKINELQTQLNNVLLEEDYLKAAEIKNEIKKLEKELKTENKKQLENNAV